jgi:hypothetical protein
MATTTIDLYAFGNRFAPRPPRLGKDLFPDDSGLVGPEKPDRPQGASLFADPSRSGLTGHYHRLPVGTPLPEGLGLFADGIDVDRASPHPPTHHTLHPAVALPADRFVELYSNLPWEYAGKL